MFPSPRRQPDLATGATIAERLKRFDCSDGGTIRAANHIFDVQRLVVQRDDGSPAQM